MATVFQCVGWRAVSPPPTPGSVFRDNHKQGLSLISLKRLRGVTFNLAARFHPQRPVITKRFVKIVPQFPGRSEFSAATC